MRLALALGRRGIGSAWPNPAVGAVVVKDGIVVGRGWTQPGGRPHAETEALKRAGREAARGGTLYVTLEPCSHHGKTPPCTDSIMRYGITRVVSAIEDPYPEVAGKGYARLRAKGIIVETGLCADEARLVHSGHIRRMREARPQVLLKLAVSADGKAGVTGPRPVAITGEATRRRVHQMRAGADAILVGIGTILADDPALTCRLPGMAGRSPVRVVLDARLRIPLATALVGTARDFPAWIFAARDASPMAEQILVAKGVEVVRVDAVDGRLDLAQVVRALSDRGITRLMVEGGPRVAASFLAADLVDEAALLTGPNAIGEEGLPALADQPLSALTQSPSLALVGEETIGPDRLQLFRRA